MFLVQFQSMYLILKSREFHNKHLFGFEGTVNRASIEGIGQSLIVV
jgi:hypothetical protein